MMNTSTLPYAGRPRTLVHPGTFNPVRIQSRHSPGARHLRLSLQPGQSLFDALLQPLRERGIESASTTILGGYFEQISYCVAPPDPTGQAVIAYSKPRSIGQAAMIFGNATIGKRQSGSFIVHCHAALRTGDGAVRGGHMVTEACIVGPLPITVLVTSLDGFELRVDFDAETNIPLLKPMSKESHD